MRSTFKATCRLSFLASCLMMVGCASVGRIDAIHREAQKDAQVAKKRMADISSGQIVREMTSPQWINPIPLDSGTERARTLPPCAISINRPGHVSLADINALISRICRIPVVVTSDVAAMQGGLASGMTRQISGAVPLPTPDANGMMPLAQMGAPTAVTAPAGNSGTTLKGLFWQGSLDGLLDNITTRLGLSWRYEGGRIAIFWLESRNYPLTFMDSKAGFEATMVSGTTTSKGSSGGSGGISGDANTSQTTALSIKSALYDDITGTVKSMLTPNVGRMYLAAGVLTVTDTSRVLEQIQHYIDDRNRELNRQVVLNVQIYSAEAKNRDQFGIDWGAVFSSGSVAASLTSAFAGVDAAAMNGGVTILDGKAAGTKALLHALSEQANVSVVTNVANLTSNLSAVPVQMALQQDYLPQITTQTVANVGTEVSATKSTITTGFNMTVLPYLMPNSSQMQLQLSINMSDDPIMRTVKQGENSTLELMKTRLKTLTQRVNIKSGQTLVLSGYEQMNRAGNSQGVGSPGFFGLGGGRDGQQNNAQLVIMITPVILG